MQQGPVSCLEFCFLVGFFLCSFLFVCLLVWRFAFLGWNRKEMICTATFVIFFHRINKLPSRHCLPFLLSPNRKTMVQSGYPSHYVICLSKAWQAFSFWLDPFAASCTCAIIAFKLTPSEKYSQALVASQSVYTP